MAQLQSTTVANDVTITGTLAGQGFVPLGGLVAIASHLTGAYSLPNSGSVDGNGLMLADGASIPGGNSVSGTAPDLNGCVFLRGHASSSGSTGGADSFSLAEAALPAHDHGATSGTGQPSTLSSTCVSSSTLNSSFSTTDCAMVKSSVNTGNQSASHSHNTCTNNTGSHTHYYCRPNFTVHGWTGAGQGGPTGTNTGGAGDHSHSGCVCTDPSANHTHSTDHDHGSHTHTYNHDHGSHSHSFGHDHGSHSHTVNNTGSTCAISHVPRYINMVYLVRVN